MADLKHFACVVDGHNDPIPNCVLDYGRPQDCLYATKGEFKTPEGCDWWQQVKGRDAKDAAIERMRGLLGEIIARHEENRDEVLNDHWGAEFDINGVLDVIDHMCVWSDIRLARIDAELKEGKS